MRASPNGHAVQQRPGREHEGCLEQHRTWNSRRSMRQREHDLEKPREIYVRGVRMRERQQILRRHPVRAEDDFAEAQIEKQIGLVHRDEAAPGHEQEQKQDHARPSCPSCRRAQLASARGAAGLCSARTIAGAFGNPPRVPITTCKSPSGTTVFVPDELCPNYLF